MHELVREVLLPLYLPSLTPSAILSSLSTQLVVDFVHQGSSCGCESGGYVCAVQRRVLTFIFKLLSVHCLYSGMTHSSLCVHAVCWEYHLQPPPSLPPPSFPLSLALYMLVPFTLSSPVIALCAPSRYAVMS